MSTVFRRDQTQPTEQVIVNTAPSADITQIIPPDIDQIIDPEAAKRRRHAALQDGIDQLRRAGSAVLAACCGDSTGMRDTLLTDINRRIESMVRELQALS